jgi:hypothetical protein
MGGWYCALRIKLRWETVFLADLIKAGIGSTFGPSGTSFQSKQLSIPVAFHTSHAASAPSELRTPAPPRNPDKTATTYIYVRGFFGG